MCAECVESVGRKELGKDSRRAHVLMNSKELILRIGIVIR